MCLRRFPWKAPRLTDNSYRLFVATPDPGQAAMLAESRRSSANVSRAPSSSNDGPPSEAQSVTGDDSSSTHHHHHHHHHHNNGSSAPGSSTVTPSSTNAHPSNDSSSTSLSASSQTIKGPLRLLRLLPRESRHIIGQMLELDPKKRATLDDILGDPWVQNAMVCRQEEGGECFHAPGHAHTLEGSGVSTSTAAPKKP